MIDWQKLLAAPYGAPLDTLCAHAELVRDERFSRRYRTAPDQYLDFFYDPLDGQVKFCGFAWVTSEGAARIIYQREGWVEVAPGGLPPPILLPQRRMLGADEIAEYGLRTEPKRFSRYVDLTHRVVIGDFVYHYRSVTPRPTDTPVAIQVQRNDGDPCQELGPMPDEFYRD